MWTLEIRTPNVQYETFWGLVVPLWGAEIFGSQSFSDLWAATSSVKKRQKEAKNCWHSCSGSYKVQQQIEITNWSWIEIPWLFVCVRAYLCIGCWHPLIHPPLKKINIFLENSALKMEFYPPPKNKINWDNPPTPKIDLMHMYAYSRTVWLGWHDFALFSRFLLLQIVMIGHGKN